MGAIAGLIGLVVVNAYANPSSTTETLPDTVDSVYNGQANEGKWFCYLPSGGFTIGFPNTVEFGLFGGDGDVVIETPKIEVSGAYLLAEPTEIPMEFGR